MTSLPNILVPALCVVSCAAFAGTVAIGLCASTSVIWRPTSHINYKTRLIMQAMKDILPRARLYMSLNLQLICLPIDRRLTGPDPPKYATAKGSVAVLIKSSWLPELVERLLAGQMHVPSFWVASACGGPIWVEARKSRLYAQYYAYRMEGVPMQRIDIECGVGPFRPAPSDDEALHVVVREKSTAIAMIFWAISVGGCCYMAIATHSAVQCFFDIHMSADRSWDTIKLLSGVNKGLTWY